MDEIRQYLLSILTAALICSIINSITGEKGTHGTIIKFVGGIFLTFTVISPLTKIELTESSLYPQWVLQQSQITVEEGRGWANTEMRGIIKEKTEAYILDKASSLGLNISAEVHTTDDPLPVPCQVTMYGDVSPYAKKIMTVFITDELGISEEDQKWM